MSDDDELTYPEQFRGHALRLLNGETVQELGLDGWQITDRSLVLGHGREGFSRAVDRLFSWRAHEHAGVKVRDLGEDRLELKFGPTLSPCLVLERSLENNRAVLVYGTVHGHVLNGEEVFHIEMAADGTVTGRCVAFSKPVWIWARIGAPVARLVQLYITGKYLNGMKP